MCPLRTGAVYPSLTCREVLLLQISSLTSCSFAWQTGRFATITNVFHNRRLANLILGLWLGMAGCVDFLVIQNFASVDRFLAAPGTVGSSQAIRQIGPEGARYLLRRNASEENAWIFENWEWIQIYISVLFFLLLLLAGRPSKWALALTAGMLIILLIQRFALTPQISAMGRDIADLPAADLAKNPENSRFWLFHGLYSGSEILKLVTGFSLAAILMFRRRTGDRAEVWSGTDRRAGERRGAKVNSIDG